MSGAACPFCAIAEMQHVELAAMSLFRWVGFPSGARRRVVIIEPLHPVVPSHVIAFTDVHAGKVSEDSRSAAAAVQALAEYAERWPYPSFNIIGSQGAPATQTVQHAHFHLVPRWPGDGLALPWSGQER